MLCVPCEMEATGEPPRDDMAAILRADILDVIEVTCDRCGHTDIRLRGCPRQVD